MPSDQKENQPSTEPEDIFPENESREFLKRQLARFRRYKSFTTLDDDGQRREYNLYMTETATGLLRDVIATTRRLSEEQQHEKEFSLEAFAAYCMYICATRCAPGVDLDDVMSKLYMEALKWLREHFENGDLWSFHSLLASRAFLRYRDILKKGHITIKETDEATGKEKKVKGNFRCESLEDANAGENDGGLRLKRKVLKKIVEDSARALVREVNRADVNSAIAFCREQGELTQEQVVILCHAYGLGDGYELLKQTEIAKKLGKSNAYVSRQLNQAIDTLRRCDREYNLFPGLQV